MKNISILNLSQFHSGNDIKGFYANTLKKHIAQNQNQITKPHKHNSYLFILFTQGSGKHEIDFSVYDVHPGSCFLISPGRTHHWKLSEDCDGYIFTHTQDFYDLHYIRNKIMQFPFFQSAQQLPSLVLEKTELNSIMPLLNELMEDYINRAVFTHQKILSTIDLIYIKMSRQYLESVNYPEDNTGSYFKKYRQFEILVEQNFLTEKSPAAYANRMHITPKHLNRIVQEITGATTTSFITDRILLEAKRNIIYSNKNFAEIALDLGYEDYAYFSRLFKHKSGFTPSEFSKSYQSL